MEAMGKEKRMGDQASSGGEMRKAGKMGNMELQAILIIILIIFFLFLWLRKKGLFW